MARPQHLKVRIRLGMLALVVGALALTGVAPVQQVFKQSKLIRQEKVELAAVSQSNAELASRLNRLKDPAYMEKLAREQLGVVRPGETAYIVVPGPPVKPVAVAKPAPQGVFEKVLSWVKGLFGRG